MNIPELREMIINGIKERRSDACEKLKFCAEAFPVNLQYDELYNDLLLLYDQMVGQCGFAMLNDKIPLVDLLPHDFAGQRNGFWSRDLTPAFMAHACEKFHAYRLIKLVPHVTGLTKLDRLIKIYKDERLTLGQAYSMAGIYCHEFMDELHKRGLGINYGVEEFRKDVEEIEKEISPPASLRQAERGGRF